MDLREFLKNINEMVAKNQDILDLVVVSSKDDEGNGFNIVNYSPSLGVYDVDEKDFSSEDSEDLTEDALFENESDDDSDEEYEPINAICIN